MQKKRMPLISSQASLNLTYPTFIHESTVTVTKLEVSVFF